MYTITYIHKDSTTENTLYLPGDTAYCLTAASLSLEVGAAGELSISIPDANPAKADFVCLTDEIIVYRDGAELWRGRAITRQEDFYKTGTLTCEGVLAYLYDTYYPPFEFSGSPTDFLQSVLDNHNAQVEERKQLQLGTVTVEDSNDYIARSSIEYNRTLTVLTDKLINDSLGGYFRVRIVDGVKYLDYLASYGTTATQPVEFGVNLLDIAQNVEYSDLATVILPLGAKLEDSDGNQTDEYLTISSVNGGSIYYADEAAVEEYGWIVVCNIWEDVTEASNLLTKAKNYLAQVTSAVSSFEVSAVDLALVSAEYDYINLGDYVLIRSDPHGINQYVELTAMDIDLLDPANDTLTFGADSASLTDAQRSSDRNVQTALESLSARYTNLVATAITTDYLTAKYITADDIAALYVKADSLEAEVAAFGYLTASDAKLTYATITDLTAATANISALTADVASINSLLAGNIGTGTVQTVHLTADNVVIDDAIITDAMIADLSASKLTAGTIYTSLIRIANDTGENLLIDGATLQIKDSAATVRVQIGEDASGDYNFYLWDASGALIWDAQGLTEAGLTGNGAIIKDVAVADDANISGYKIDITTMTSALNEYGELTVDAAQITIDNTTLDYKLTTMVSTTAEAQAAADAAAEIAAALKSDAVSTLTQYYSVGDSAEAPPSAPGDGVTRAAALADTAVADESRVGVIATEADWTTAWLTASDGLYLWTAFFVAYADGAAEWTTPTCLSDSAARDSISTLVTELAVVQGQITAKVWQTDIDEAADALNGSLTTLQDRYSAMTQTVDGMTTEVANLTTVVGENYTSLESKITTVETTASGITARVSDLETTVSGNYTDLSDKIAALTVTTDGITATVSDLETTVSNNYKTLESKITTVETTASGISARVTQTESDISDNTASITTLSSELTQLADSIALCVTTDADTGYLRLGAGDDGTVKFTIEADNLTLDKSGNLAMTGNLTVMDRITMSSDTAYITGPSRIHMKTIVYGENGFAVGVSNGGDSNGYFARDSSNVNHRVLWLTTTDYVHIGNGDYPLYVEGTNVTFAAPINGVTTRNGSDYAYKCRDSSDTAVNIMWMSGDAIGLGNSSYSTYIYGSSIHSNVSITVSSDERLKQDIVALDSAHDALFDGLRPVAYRYKADPSKLHMGMTVQDTEAAELTAGLRPEDYALTDWQLDAETGDHYGALAYGEVIALLVQQVQQLKARVKAMEGG